MKAFNQKIIKYGQTLIKNEIKEAAKLLQRIDDNFVKAVQIILNTNGKVIITGIGKSGLIGQKVAASLSSTGTPACFMHLSEALHGDLGMISECDCVMIISYSGISKEINYILPFLNEKNISIIAITGKKNSLLAKKANAVLDISIESEACPINLAPTSSSTNTLIMGDALTGTLMQMRGFKESDFAKFHPAGQLGNLLLKKVKDIMRTEEQTPKILTTNTVFEAMLELSRTGLGLVTVCDENDEVIGVFTDGDLRRHLLNQGNLHDNINHIITKNCYKLHEEDKATYALTVFNENNITAAPVINSTNKITGAINIHDLHQAGILKNK